MKYNKVLASSTWTVSTPLKWNCETGLNTYLPIDTLCLYVAWYTITLTQLSIITVVPCFSPSCICADCCDFAACTLDVFFNLSLPHPWTTFPVSTGCPGLAFCLLWSDSLLPRCLKQLSNLINSIIRSLFLPGCFSRVWAPEAGWREGLWANGDRLV